MEVRVTILGIVISVVASMVLGYLWYGPKMFGNQWKKLAGLKEKDMKKMAPQAMSWMVATSLLSSFVLNHMINFAHHFNRVEWLEAGLMTGLWLGVGIAATALISHSAYELKPKKLIWINVGYSVVSLTLKGMIIGWFLSR